MKLVFIIVLLSTCWIIGVLSNCEGSLLLLQDYPNARCLDNTPSGFYYRPSPNTNSWVINLQGGGECISQRSCTARSKTDLGSSNEWPMQRSLTTQFQSCDNSVNPYAHHHQIFIPYCSGDLFFGRDTEVNERAFGLRFSGYYTVLSAMDYLLTNLDLHKADQIIITGLSAGGIGVVGLIDEIADYIFIKIGHNHQPYHLTQRMVSGKALSGPKIVGAPIAAYHFPTVPTYKRLNDDDPAPIPYIPWKSSDFEKYYHLWNAFVPRRCQEGRTSKYDYECMFAYRNYYTTVTPMFFLQSLADPVVASLHGACPEVWNDKENPQCNSPTAPCNESVHQFMSTWHRNATQAVQPIFHRRRPKPVQIDYSNANTNTAGQYDNGPYVDGLFGVACLIHTEFGSKYPRVHDLTYIEAFNAWLQDKKTYEPYSTNPHFHREQCGGDAFLCGTCSNENIYN